MNGKLNQDIVNLFKIKFEGNCIKLLLDAYTSLINSGSNVVEASENNITVQLVGFMKKNPLRSDLQIHLERESYLDSEESYDGMQDADKSPRIDIKYSVWNTNIEIEYYMEAKNLAENNWNKRSNNALVDAYKLRRRYIETGIDNFINGKYPNGCLLGYILEGNTAKIIELINNLLKSDNRDSEILNANTSGGIDYEYISKHKEKSMPVLKHYLLRLS